MNDQTRIHEHCACSALLSAAVHGEHVLDPGRGFVLGGTERVYERARPFTIEHISLDWTVDHAASSLRGSAELELRRIDAEAAEVTLDAVGFEIESVALRPVRPRAVIAPVRRPAPTRAAGERGWRRASYVYDGELLQVRLARGIERVALRVRYRATPLRGMYFLAPDAAVPDRPRQLWTQCQDEDARRLFPCHDKPHVRQTMTLSVRVEPGWFALSNGELCSSRAEQRRGLFRYRMAEPLPSYLFTLVAGEFDSYQERVGPVALRYYVPRGRLRDARRSFARTADMVRLYQQRTGVAYPWGSYAQVVVHDFIFGGMENTGATTLYEHVLLDERAAIDVSSDELIAHELAHQWFGNLVTCRDWSHAWLNEGFATFLELVYREHHLGRDEYELALRDDLGAYLSEADSRYQRPVVCLDYQAPVEVFDRHLYQKGALLLHVLRRSLGEEPFWRGVRCYLERHAGGEVETRDLQRALEAASGHSLEQFFEHGLYRAGHPKVEIGVEHDGKLLLVTVKQTVPADTPPFAFDLELDIAPGPVGARRKAAAGARGALVRERRRVTKALETFVFALPERPRFVVVDPELGIVGRVTVRAPADMLRRQLAGAPSARGRVLAAEALGKLDDPATANALGAALGDARSFWGTRAAAASALGAVRSPAALARLTRASTIRHPKVRRAVVTALGQFRRPEVARLLARIAQSDPSLLVAASAARALGATRQGSAYAELCKLVDRPSWGDVLRSGAIDGLCELRDERAVELLRAQSAYGVPTRGRRAAIVALGKLATGRAVREQLEDLLEAETPLLRTAAAEALGEIGDPKSRSALGRRLERELDGRVRRRIREVLRDLGAKGRQEMRRVRDELDELRRAHDELRTRLGKLEARPTPAATGRGRARRRPGPRRSALR